MIVERNTAVIEVAKTFLQMFVIQCSQYANRAGSFNINPIKLKTAYPVTARVLWWPGMIALELDFLSHTRIL